MLPSWVAPSPDRRRQTRAWVDVERVASTDDRRAEQADETEAHHGGERTLQLDRFDAQVAGAVDAEQHDDEQEQHDDGPGVDDHLDDGHEVGPERDELHGDTEECEDEPERGVHRVAECDDTDGPTEDHHRGREEHHVFEERGITHR